MIHSNLSFSSKINKNHYSDKKNKKAGLKVLLANKTELSSTNYKRVIDQIKPIIYNI